MEQVVIFIVLLCAIYLILTQILSKNTTVYIITIEKCIEIFVFNVSWAKKLFEAQNNMKGSEQS